MPTFRWALSRILYRCVAFSAVPQLESAVAGADMFVDVIHAFTILAINTFAIVYICAGREGSGVSASWLVPIFLTRDFI